MNQLIMRIKWSSFFLQLYNISISIIAKKTFVSEGLILVRNISIIIFWNVLAFQLNRKSFSAKITCNPNNTIAKKDYFCKYINNFVLIIRNGHDNGALISRDGQKHMCLPDKSAVSAPILLFVSSISKGSPLQYYFAALDLPVLNL